jgi:2-polyprenyl-3-methyl-5-hydroxy-6-metoxy-1,4-benzoquinol methylase
MTYDEDYESTQAVSPTYNTFLERLVRSIIDRFDVRSKKVVEIGCGQGEFLIMLCELGGNFGFGFDPANRGAAENVRVKFFRDIYCEKYRNIEPDFVASKMMLEHIRDVGPFLRKLREMVGDREQTIVFFMIPDVTRILDLGAFWDL